jgi:hypothetical protein
VFDTIAGLPIHALTVHAVVVLLPLMALITMAVAVRPAWRGYGRLVLAADLLVLVVSFVARQSGLKFEARIQQFGNSGTAKHLIDTHAGYGKMLPFFALALVVAAALVVVAASRPRLGIPVAALAVIAGLAAIGWTVLTGDSGARAVWESTIQNTTAP